MELRLPAPCLIVLVGPAGSGKTTWSAETFADTEIVSSDRLRAVVGAGEDDQTAGTVAFALLEQIVAERVRRRLTTVIDTLGFDRERRRHWVALARAARVPVFAVVFETPPAEIRRRNSVRPRPVPKGVFDKQVRRFEEVRAELEDDGFDQILTEQPIVVVAPAIVAAGPTSEADPVPPGGHSFGLVLNRFAWDPGHGPMPEQLATIAQRAETAGFRDIWVMDHFRQIPRIGPEWEDIPEAYVTLSYLAGVTSRIRLGALVTAVGHRHPVVLGKMVATLDVLSGGRANLGLGIGWDRAEHEEYGIPFPPTAARYDLLEDTLAMLPLLWGKGSPSFEGSTFSAAKLTCYPRPLQERIPILIGGSGEKTTLRLVARYADACNLFGRPDVIRHKVEILRRHCSDLGREPGQIEVSHLVDLMTAPDRQALRARVDLLRGRNAPAELFMARHNAGTVDDQQAHIAAYHDAGASHSMIVLPDVHLDGSIETFAQVIAKLAGT
ncbi:MAG TPA: TIGR03560 family F420-dependent LLM class oxidoreductase [Acidimicrobiia bacterium]|nr:TIGR03560 family F420-dependent LLM class oxidoreductase [Acidimicrobiia bacterium]